MENLEQEIIALLRERPMISEEIRDKLMEKGVHLTPLELRETLATMVREGKIEKYPDYDRRKFYFRLRSDNF